jgi:signal transduction histidine kinase
MIMNRGGSEKRVISVNADLIALESGDRVIYSFFDLTDLRRAEEELRQSADEIRQLYVRLATVEDDERRALHAELHDRVGANLAALRLELDIAEKHLAGGDAANVQRHLESARAVAAETMAIARNLMAELRPPALDDFGLVAALREFADGHSRRLDVPVDVVGPNLTPRPGLLVESTLFRIAQEAVVNATRHASATCVTISVVDRDGRIAMIVGDDGVGFDPEVPDIGPDHWGLRNMRERARAIGGTLRIESAAGAGTRIIAEIPRGAE